MTFPLNLQCKQYVAVVMGRFGIRFRVYTTGDDKFYLFDPLDAQDCSMCNALPVRKSDLKPDIRRALAHGYGNSL